MRNWLMIVAVLMFLPACDGPGEIDPIEAACGVCQMLDESGICDVIQQLHAEKCEPGQELVIVDLKGSFEENLPIVTECR